MRSVVATDEARTRSTAKKREWRAANPEKVRRINQRSAKKRSVKRAAEAKEWRAKNKEKATASVAKWRRANKDKVLADARALRERKIAANPTAVRACENARYRRWRSKNIELARQRSKEWAANHRDQARRNLIVRRARGRAAVGRFSAKTLKALMESYHRLCVYCLRHATSADHVVPIAGGGDNFIDNIVPACISCNASKSDTTMLVWMAKRQLMGVPFATSEIAGEYEP